MWLTAQKGKGLEISGTWSLRNNVITMEMTFSNKAMQAMQGFGIQLNKNSFGMTTSQPLNIPLLNAGQTLDVALPMTCTGPVQKMDPLTNIQVELLLAYILKYFQANLKLTQTILFSPRLLSRIASTFSILPALLLFIYFSQKKVTYRSKCCD